ncbi:transposase family protein [Streptomyces sp. CA-135486]|uniref:transposase family protein n=1 Tax=Streptomyces sp. CA-135486 TaxID=3240049 RepID=UPI003D8C38D0
MTKKWARAALSHPAFTGVSRAHLGGLIEELAGPWQARRESALHQRRGGKRHRAAGTGRKHELVFTDRMLVALVHLRTQLPHAALAELYGVGRSTVTEAIGEIRPPRADRGFAVPDQPGLRLLTLADVFAYADAEGVTSRIDGTETQVRRPKAHRPGRCAFGSGKKKQNTMKTTTISDGQGRTLWSVADRPGRMHDQTAMRTEGIAEQFRLHPDVRAEVDEGYGGLANEFPEHVSAPPKKPKEDAPLGDRYAWRERRHRQPSARICVEHANAEHKQWRPLQRFLGRREHYPATHRAGAGLVSDRASQRPTRRKPSTELVPVSPMTC